MLVYRSTKRYPHSAGLSCAFRQWRAASHCQHLHGYALAVRVEFEATRLDGRNWVVDFGGLKTFKAWLERTFDHKTLVATDDPEIDWFREGHKRGILDLLEVPATGCERFAEMIFKEAELWLFQQDLADRCRVALVEVSEHEGNSAIVTRQA